MRARAAGAVLSAVLVATPAAGDPLTITKTVAAVSDPVGNVVPRSLPGGVTEYRTTATNPVGNALKTVRDVVLLEPLAPTVILRVADIGTAGKGPVEFADGGLLGTGLLPSGLTYSYAGLAAAGDGLEFFDGTSWGYKPVADADGYDAKVRAIRVTLGGNFATLTSFRLRYRVKIR